MTYNYYITFYDAEKEDVGGGNLERHFTHSNTDVIKFWWDLCYSEMPKKEFLVRFQEKINSYDINSESFQYLMGSLGLIVNMTGWADAVIIHVNRD